MSVIQRVHYFTIQECKRVFWHHDYGVVRFDDMITNAQVYGLDTVCVAGISVENLPLYYRQFFFPTSRFSASRFLRNFWSHSYSNRYVREITGKPELLIIDRRLEACLNSTFFKWLEREDIDYRYSAAGDKKFSSVIRQHQSYPHIFIFKEIAPEPVQGNLEPWPLSLDTLNEKEASYTSLRGDLSPTVRQTLDTLYPDNFRPELAREAPVADDFLFKEGELRVTSSNDIELNAVAWHPAKEEPFSYGYAINNCEELSETSSSPYWQKEILIALQCLELQFDRLARELTRCFGNNYYSNTINKIKKNKYKTLLPLNVTEQNKLFILTGLNTNSPEGHTIYDISKLNVSNALTLWEHITNGGDQRQSFEIRPRNGIDDPAYRLFAVIGYYSCYYLIAHRGSRSCNALDSGRCINYEQEQPRLVRQQDYRKMLNSAIAGNAKAFASTLSVYLFV